MIVRRSKDTAVPLQRLLIIRHTNNKQKSFGLCQ